MPSLPATACRLLLALLLLLGAPLALAQREAPEPELKAAILANMLLFVDWPADGARVADRLTVCYLGPAPVSTALAQLDGKLLKGKPLRVTRVDIAQMEGCHALYVSPTEAAILSRLVANPRVSGILLIGDSPGYLQQGVMLNLEIDSRRVIFDVGLHSARQAGLSISSKALRLARQVLEE